VHVWKIRLADPNDGKKPEVGDMWPCDYWPARWLSTYYDTHWKGKRLPMMVQLPSGPFCIDMSVMKDGHPDPPNVTLSPSVNIVGSYHGWIQNGIISEDCEGRKFPHPGT
jgi:hypothetical protein